MASDAEVVKRGWEAVARGDWDTLIADYTEDMIFVMPGQSDVLEGKAAFRNALENIGAALPPGFDIASIHEIGETGKLYLSSSGRATRSREVANLRCCLGSLREKSTKSGGSWTRSSGKPLFERFTWPCLTKSI